ncbi:uncharacterized protein PFL1_04002 [Pseudozyma flocculosa PF-1]|uniref:N-acetyltransferase domain-containing protein n=1 Tax=Pseudozyma flocculosa PF-1 TaxID=1277687 RepID=A0A061H8B4_9BASI|nr:uncharacterized protein PFL1_04002 [Pseudozyma flocculosa PF-1]EPQ28699.1 hypothetical protein PFL1_04002 [Pseudozyma flocculosa PF-1]
MESTTTIGTTFRIAKPGNDDDIHQAHTDTDTETETETETETDLAFILSAFDSALPYLSSIGSAQQWGDIPFSSRPKTRTEFAQFIRSSYRLSLLPRDGDGDGDGQGEEGGRWCRMILALRGETRVAACGLSTWLPDYLPPSLVDQIRQRLHDDDGSAPRFLYLNYLITHRFRPSRGAGAQLIHHALDLARHRRIPWILVDCWCGNAGGLVRFYQQHGFHPIGDAFVAPGKHKDGLEWRGSVLGRRID